MLEWVNRSMPGIRHSILRPFVFKINPNIITILALVAAVAAGLAFWKQCLFLAAFFVLLNGFLDILDGEIAKKYGKSKRGDLLDHTVDRLADIAMIIGIIAGGFAEQWLGLWTIIFILLVSYIGTAAQALINKRLYAGLLTRADRLILLFIGAVAELFWPGALSAVVAIVLILSAVTFCQRFSTIWKTLG